MMSALLLLIAGAIGSEIVHSAARGNINVPFVTYLPGPTTTKCYEFADLKLKNMTVVSLPEQSDVCYADQIPQAPDDQSVLVTYFEVWCQNEPAARNVASKGYKAYIFSLAYFADDVSAGRLTKALYFSCDMTIPFYTTKLGSALFDYRNDSVRVDLETSENPALEVSYSFAGVIGCVVAAVILLAKLLLAGLMLKLTIQSGSGMNTAFFVIVLELCHSLTTALLLFDFGFFLAVWTYEKYVILVNLATLLSNLSTAIVALAFRRSLEAAHVIARTPWIDWLLTFTLAFLTVMSVAVTMATAGFISSDLPLGVLNVLFNFFYQLFFFFLFFRYRSKVFAIYASAAENTPENDSSTELCF